MRQAWIEIYAQRGWIGKVALSVTAVSMLLWLLMPAKYQAEITLMPVEKDLGELNLISGIGGAGGFEMLKSQLVGGTSADRLKNFLNSRSLTQRMIKQMNLMPVLHPGAWDAKANNWKNPKNPPSLIKTVDKFKSQVLRVYDTAEGLIYVSVLWPRDPQMAAKIANRIPKELEETLNESGVTMARKKREFVEVELDKAKEKLTDAENQFREFQEREKIYSFEQQAKEAIGALAKLEGKLIAKDVELGVQKQFATASNQQVQLLEKEVAALREQIDKMKIDEPETEHSFFPAFDKAPELQVEFLRRQREVIIAEQVSGLLTQQYIQAQIEEARQRILFQVVDRADVPEKPAGPLWWVHLFGGLLIGLAAGTVAVLYGEKAGEMIKRLRVLAASVDEKPDIKP